MSYFKYTARVWCRSVGYETTWRDAVNKADRTALELLKDGPLDAPVEIYRVGFRDVLIERYTIDQNGTKTNRWHEIDYK